LTADHLSFEDGRRERVKLQDLAFLGRSAVEWGGVAAIAATIAALASVVSTVIVAIVAKFTFEYMRSTKELVEAARSKYDAAIRQADASIKTLELMNIERLETESFQRAIFVYSVEGMGSALGRYVGVINSPAHPWHEKDCLLFPPDWDTCRAFISRKAPNLLDEMQEIEKDLNEASCAIQGFIRAPDSQWLSSIQNRQRTALRLATIQNRLSVFRRNVLKTGAP